MNRLLITSFFALALIVGATGAAPVAHANANDTNNSNIQLDSNGNITGNTTGITADPFANAAATAAAQSAANQTPTNINQGSSDTAFNPVMTAIAGLFAWLVGVAALTLDYAVYYTVVNMGAYISKLTAIGVTWRILRDIGNIMLIFGFLAIGISVILNTERIGYGKKMLPMLLVAAVFLNFSLFFSEAIIDTGNLFATQFYTQINGGVTPTAATLKGVTTANQGISSKLMSQLGLATIYDVKNNSASLAKNTPWYIGFLSILLFIVTAFVMFSLAFILIARFIVLVFLIILAPIGFAGLAVPQLKHKAGQWWSALFQQTITAPVLLLLLYVALAVITDAQFLTGLGGGSAGAITGFVDNNNLPAFASYMMSFSIAIGLMLAVTISAKGLSAFGADKATALAGKITGGAIGYGLMGGASLVGRGTLGLAGRALSSKRMQARAATGGFGTKLTVASGKFLANRTYDARNLSKVPGVGKVTGALAGAFAVGGAGAIVKGVGNGATVTAQKAVDSTIETYKKYKPFTGDWFRDQQKVYEKVADEQKRKSDLSAAVLPTIPPHPLSVAAQKELKKMSVDELAQLKDIRGGIDTLVHNLSPEKYNELMKSDKLLAGEKTKLKDTWEDQFDTANVGVTMNRLSTEEVAALGGGTLLRPNGGVPRAGRPVIDTLGVSEFDAIRRKGNLSKQERHDIHAHMMAVVVAAPASALGLATADYFNAANDPGGNRKRYWDV